MKKHLYITSILTAVFVVALSLTPQPAKSIDFGKLGDALKKGTKIVKAMSISYPAEREIGRAAAAQISSKFGIVNDPGLNQYVRLVGNAVAAYSDRPATEFCFAVLDSDDINAYAAPGGYIFITKGALKACKSEAELAGVLAHEIAHVTERHYVKSVQKFLIAQALVEITMEKLTKDFKLFNNLVEQITMNIITKGLSRKDEYESDQKGTEFATRVGYNPYGVRDFLQTLRKYSGVKGDKRSMFATHPALDKRVERVEKLIKKEKWDNPVRPTLTERYVSGTKFLKTK